MFVVGFLEIPLIIISDSLGIQSCISSVYLSNKALDKSQLEKVLAINQLFNIAKYYNGDWKPNWNNRLKYYIIYNHDENRFEIRELGKFNFGIPIFKNVKDARAVINNPNFQSILNIILKN